MATKRTKAELLARQFRDDPRDFMADVAESLQHEDEALTGNVTGNVVGEHRHSVQTLTATGAITLGSGLVQLNHATVIIAATKAAPVAGDELYIVDNSASGTAAHTVTFAGATLDGSATIATLNAPGEALHLIALSATRWFILENIGSVALS